MLLNNELKAWCFLIILVLSLLGTIGGAIFDWQLGIAIERDITGWYHRAADAVDPATMHEYLNRTVQGVEARGATTGYASFFYPTPDNDAAIFYATLLDQRDQAAVLIEMDRSTPEYQSGLDNLRDSINDSEFNFKKHWYVHNTPALYWLWMACIMIFVLALVFLRAVPTD